MNLDLDYRAGLGRIQAGYVEIFKIVLVIYGLIALLSTRISARSVNRGFSVLKRMRLGRSAMALLYDFDVFFTECVIH